MTLHRLAVSLASRRIRPRSLASAATRSLSTSSSSHAAAGGEDGAAAAAAAAAEGLTGTAAEACSSSSSLSLHLLLPDASAPVAAAASLLDAIGPNSSSLSSISLPWWAAIPTAAVAVRAALLPLSVAQARSAAALGPLLRRAREEEWQREEEEEERLARQAATDDAGSVASKEDDDGSEQQTTTKPQRRRPPPLSTLLRRVLRLREQTRSPHPLWLLASPLLQLPVFASAVLGVRAMAAAGWPGFADGGALWFPDLTARAVEIASSASSAAVSSSAADAASSSFSSLASLTAPMGVAGGLLPALVAAGTLAAAASAVGRVGTGPAGAQAAAASASASSPPPSPSLPLLRVLLEWLALPAFVGSLLLPQGAVLYWASSSGAALAQGALLRSGAARELLGLREIAERAAAGRGKEAGSTAAPGGAPLLSPPPSDSSTMPRAALALLSRAAELRAAGDVEEAIKAASAAVAASRGRSARAWFALGQLRATAAHWHDAELAFLECARLEEHEEEETETGDDENGAAGFSRSDRKHEQARALFGAGVAQSMQGDSEAASDTLRRAVAAAEEAWGGAAAVEAEVERRRKSARAAAAAKDTKKKKNSPPAKPLPPPLATLARSLLALASSLDAQGGRTAEALAVARRAAGLDEGAERMAAAPLTEKLRREREEKGRL